MTYWLNGEAYLVQDSEKDPVYQFTNGNVINGEFTYEGTANKTRTNSIIVNWNNPQDYYRSRSEIVELEENLQKDNEFIKPEETTAFGCTSRGQARRLGKWKLLTNNWNTNTVSFSTSLNAAFLRPGDIIQVIDQHKEGKSWGGRVSASSSTTAINIDRKPTGFADGTGTNGGETGYSVADYRLTISYVGYKATLAQDTAVIDIEGTNTSFVRGQEISTWRDTDGIIGTTTAVGSTSGSSKTVTLTAANDDIKTGMLVTGTGITAGDTVEGIDGTTLTLSTARTVSAATLTFGWEDADGDITVKNEELAASVFDVDGNLVFVQWTPFTFTETQTLNEVSNSGKTLTVASAFNAAPTQEAIWVISRAALATGKTKKEAKLFRVMAIAENDRSNFEITCLEYNSSKFDAVDKNEALTQDRQIYLPDSFKAVPAVENIRAIPSIRTGGTDQGNYNVLTVEWDPAMSTSDDGVKLPYNSVRHYQVEFSKDNAKWFGAGSTPNTDIELDAANIISGTYYFRIYTTSLNGVRSPVAESGAVTVNFNKAVGPAEGKVGQGTHWINFIGNNSGSFSLNASTGKVSFSPVNFYHNDGNNEHTVTSQAQLDFSGLTGSNTDNNGANTGYVYFDQSASAFKAIAFDEVSGQFYPVGSSVFATATGTLTADLTSQATKWTGLDSTAFSSELKVGNVFKYTKSSTDYYHRVLEIESNSVLYSEQPTTNTITNADNQAFSKPSFLADYLSTSADTIMGKVVKDGSNAYTLQRYGTSQGEPGYSVFGTNESHTFSADSSGAISNSNYTAYTNDFTVKKGEQSFTYASSGTAQNTFSITLQSKTGFSNNADINISGAGQITIDDNSLDSVDAATATLRLTDLGTGQIITDRVLSFAKASDGTDGQAGDNAKVVVVSPSSHVMFKESLVENEADAGGIVNIYHPNQITIKAQTANTTADGVWSTSAGTLTSKVSTHTGPSCVVTAANMVDGMTVTYTLHSDDGSSSDSVTLELLDAVEGGVTVVLTNEAHTLPASAAGAVSDYSGSGTNIKVYEGAGMLDYDGTGTANGHWKVTVGNAAEGTLTEGSASSSGSGNVRFATIGAHSGAANGVDQYLIPYTITGKTSRGTGFTHIKYQTITKSKTGDAGSDGQGVRVETIFKKNDSSLTSTTGGSFSNPLTGNTDWSLSMPALSSDGDIAYAATRTFTSDGQSPQDSTWTTPVAVLTRTNGTNATALTITSTQANTPSSGRTTINFSDGSSFIVDNGQNGADGDGLDVIYKTASSTPSTPSASSGAPSGWSFTIPSEPSGSNRIYVSFGVRTNNTGNYTWSAARILSGADGDDGAPGANGTNAKVVYYGKTGAARWSTAPSDPSGNITSTSTGNNVWTTASLSNSGTVQVWQSTGTDASGSWVWSKPFMWFDRSVVDNLFINEFGLDLDLSGLAILNLTDSSYNNTTVTNSLVWGSISATTGSTAASFSSLDNGTNFTGYNTTGEIAITHPTLGTFEANYAWAKGTGASNGQVTSFTLTNNTTGNDEWTSSSFGSAAESKTITVTHEASSNTIVMACSVSIINLGSGGGSGGGGGGGCFLPETLVDLPGDMKKEIQDIKIGDYVRTEHDHDQVDGVAQVTNIGSITVDSYYLLNQELGLTAGHPIWVEDKGWACIDPGDYYKECKQLNHVIDLEPVELEIGDKTTNGEVEILNKIDEQQEVWWITVDNTHTYYVNGKLVHNGGKQ